MPDRMADRFRNWFRYEQDAHAKVLRSLESVPAERRDSAEFRKAVGWLAHLVMARRAWLGRIGIIPHQVTAIFPDDMKLAEVSAELQAVEELWSRYLQSLSDEDLDRRIEYKSIDAGRFRNRLEDILTQLFGHSSYHRGQIATLVRAAGGVPAVTDFIYWCREPVADRLDPTTA